MQWWKSIVLGVPVSMMVMGSAQAETYVKTRWMSMSLSFSQCIKEAKAVLETGRFEGNPGHSQHPLTDGSGSAWGGRNSGNYKAVIKCLPDQELVFLVVAGPNETTISGYVDNLAESFTGN